MQQIRVIGKRVAIPCILEDLFLGTLYLAGFESAPFEQLFQLGVGLNHVALAQQDIPVGVIDIPGQGAADGQRAGGDSDKFGQIRCLVYRLII